MFTSHPILAHLLCIFEAPMFVNNFQFSNNKKTRKKTSQDIKRGENKIKEDKMKNKIEGEERERREGGKEKNGKKRKNKERERRNVWKKSIFNAFKLLEERKKRRAKTRSWLD